MSIGKRIKEIRMVLNLKQKEMAKCMKISQGYLCGIESGEKQANATVIFTLLNQFDVNPRWLDNGIGSMFSGADNCVLIKPFEVAEQKPGYGYPMPKELIEIQLNKSSKDLIMCQIRTDNMSPTIKKDDLVIIDKSDNNMEEEGIYLFTHEDKKFIRRLLFKPEKHLVYDNSNLIHGSIILDSSINCIGKVVWFGRKI